MNFLSTSDIQKGSSVIVRADLDVPLDSSGNILETFRLDSLKPTLGYLKERECHIIICGHIGRPGGLSDPQLSTEYLLPYFDNVLGKGAYELLENLRFNSGEKSGDLEFARTLAEKADYYVNDSFATCHRDAASITGIPQFLPAYAGVCLEKEINNLAQVLQAKQRPLVAIVGGVKESKKEAIYALAEYADYVLVGGKLSKGENDPNDPKVLYPVDYSEDGFDLGSKTVAKYSAVIKDASMIVWAGPMGAYDQGFYEASKGVAEAILDSSAYSIVGGGDTITCLNQLGLLEKFDFVSTGGGAMLDFLSGKELPGLRALGYYGENS